MTTTTVDFAILPNHKGKVKESKMIGKYMDLASEQKIGEFGNQKT